MSGIELFKLFATLSLDTSEFESGVKAAKREGESLFGFFDGAESKLTKLSSALSVIKDVGSAISDVLRGAAEAGIELVEVSANLKAMDESMTSTFANLRPIAESFFKQISALNNIEMGRLQQSGLGFFRQFVGAGLPDSIAITEMARALGLAADAAAAADISLENASEMMRSFIRGNVEAGEAIGVFTSATQRDNDAMEKYGKTWNELNEAQRQFLMLDNVEATYRRSGVFGQGAREMYNYTNVVGNLARVWSEAQALMGDKIREALIPALMDLTDWIKENPDIFTNIGETLGHIATAMVNAFQSLLTFISAHEDDILNFINSLNALFSGEKSLAQVLFGGGESNTPTPVVSEADKRAAAMAWLTGEGSYTAAEAAFGKGDAVLGKLLTKFNDGGAENVTAEVAAQWIDEAFASLQSDLNAENFTANVSIDAVMGKGWDLLVSGANWLGRSLFGDRPGENEGAKFNAKGLDYVPYNDYVTRLHRGEKIMSRVEAENWRTTAKDFGRGADPEAIGSAVKAALAGVSVTMDGRSVGTLVTPYVSREQKAEYWRNR